MASQQQTVWLGLAGDIIGAEEALDHHATKCGGAPLYPGQRPPLSGEDLKCRVCGKQLSLVLQAYAPTGSHDNRCLLIFGCTSDQCGIKPGSWRAWRCQLEPHLATADAASATAAPATSSNTDSNAAAASTTAAIQQQQQPTDDESMPGFDFEAAADDWGLGADGSADGAFGSSSFSVADGALDFSDLASAVEQAAADLSAAKRKAASAKAAAGAGAAAAIAAAAGGGTGGGAAGVASCMGVAGPWLPGFHIYAEEEPADVSVPEHELQHARQLLAKYQEAANEAADSASTSASPATQGGSGPSSSSSGGGGGTGSSGGGGRNKGAGGRQDDEGGAESWAGEGYEPTQMRGVVRSYVKFSKRLSRQPLQCVRYCPGSQPLWPHPSPPQAQPCGSCGAPRAFELQLMPALIQMIVEAADMEREASKEGGSAPAAAVLSTVSQWDWCTIALYTCSAGCTGRRSSGSSAEEGSCGCIEEQLVVVNEQELHTLPESNAAAAALQL